MQGIVHEFPLPFSETELTGNDSENSEAQSHDCAYEFSPEHWMEVYRMVQEEYLLAETADGEGAGWYQTVA